MLEDTFDINAIFENNRALFGDTRMDSEMVPEGGGESAPVGNDSAQGESTGGNPAWQDILNVLPDSLHSTVRPALEKWDQGVQQRFQTVHSQYEPFKPFLESGIDPQNINYALAILDKIENDPRSIYDALAEHNGWAEQQGQPESEIDSNEYDPENIPDDPRLLRAEQLAEAVAEYTMQQHQEQLAAQEDAALDAHISDLKAQHEIAEDDQVADRFVLGLMLAGASAEDAFNEYVNMQSTVATRPRANDSAPTVLGNSGGVPSTAIPRDQIRDPKARRALVAQMLEQSQ